MRVFRGFKKSVYPGIWRTDNHRRNGREPVLADPGGDCPRAGREADGRIGQRCRNFGKGLAGLKRTGLERGRRRTRQDQISRLSLEAIEPQDFAKLRTTGVSHRTKKNLFLLPDRLSMGASSPK